MTLLGPLTLVASDVIEVNEGVVLRLDVVSVNAVLEPVEESGSEEIGSDKVETDGFDIESEDFITAPETESVLDTPRDEIAVVTVSLGVGDFVCPAVVGSV